MKSFLRKKFVIAAVVPAIGMPLALSSFAQSTDTQGTQAGQSQQQSQGQQGAQQQQGRPGQQATKIRDMRASNIIGAKVESVKGEELGDVQDLIVDANDGRVNYAIVAFGGTLGFGEKLFAYPIDRFQASSTGDALVLNATEQEMKQAPGFDRSNWPSFGSGGYRGEVQKHFGQPVQTGGELARMSEMLDSKVVDQAGLEVGEINDVVVSVTDGKVRYVALEPADDLNMENQLVMLPMDALSATGKKRFESKQQAQQQAQQGQQGQQDQQQAQQGQQGQQDQQQAQQGQDQDLLLVLNIESSQLRNARTIKEDQWPDLNNQAFQSEMDSYVASFPSGAQGGTMSGASGSQQTTTSGSSGGQEAASGASGGQDSTSSGSSGGQSGSASGSGQGQGQTGSGAAESGTQQNQPAASPPSAQ